MEPRRAERVAEALREELSEIVEYEMSDPRLGTVAITGVEVSRDLRHAQVRVLVPGGGSEREEALKALEGARFYIRRELAARVRLWRVPELHFEPDSADDATSRIEELLKRVRKNRSRGEESAN